MPTAARSIRGPQSKWIAAAAAVAALAAGLSWLVRQPSPPDIVGAPSSAADGTTTTAPGASTGPGTSSAPTAPSAPTMPTVPEGWSAVSTPDTVAAFGEVMVWSGDELLVWGGQDATSQNVPSGEPGAAYELQSQRWRVLPAGPKPAAVGAAGVWTGDSMIITGGATGSNGHIPSGATAAYHPSTNSWRELADSPILSNFSNAVWTGTEMIVTGATGVAVYDPANELWRVAATPPVELGRLRTTVWTGNELIVWPTSVERGVHRGVALDVSANTWRTLPDPPAWPASPSIVSTGEVLIIWGALPAPGADDSERAVGSVYDPSTDSWNVMPDALPEPDSCECNIGSQTIVWTGRQLVASTGYLGSGLGGLGASAQLLRYDPRSNGWFLIGASPLPPGANVLMADERIVARSDQLFISEPGWMPEGVPLP